MQAISIRRVAIGLWVALIPFLVVLLFWPINSLSLRLGILFAFAAILGGLLFLLWRQRNLRFAFVGICFAIGIFMIFPGRPGSDGVAAAYVNEMSSYEGVPYVWGGETSFGIDCSGLVRKGYQNALLREGLRTLNPRLVRSSLDLWWNDTTAREIGRGYAGRTVHVIDTPSINGLDPALIRPGDMAVTSTGIHVMVYLGGNRWIGADPGEEKVTVFTFPGNDSGWFSTPVRIMRWKDGRR